MNIFDFTKKFTDGFFDGLKDNAVDSMLAKASKARLEQDEINSLERINREKMMLDKILSSIPEPKFHIKKNEIEVSDLTSNDTRASKIEKQIF